MKDKLRLLITGATGFIGTNFILSLHEKYQITALVRQNSNTSKIEKLCEIYRFDDDIQKLSDFIFQKNFDGVVHLATLYIKNHHSKDISKLVNSNITFGTQLLESLVMSRCKNLLFFINTITFSMYANSNEYNPVNLYDSSKKAFCDIMMFYTQKLKNTIFTNLLLYDTYGNNDTRDKIFNLWIKIAKSGELLEMSGGEQNIDLSHIYDVINGFDTLINMILNKEIKNNQIYSLENKRHCLKDIAKIFENATNSKLNIKWGAKPYRENEIMNPISQINLDKIKKLPNWIPQISLEKGFKMLFTNNTTGGGGI